MASQIPVYRHGAVAAYALVDDDDAEIVNGVRWQLHPKGYAVRIQNRLGRCTHFKMHRVLLGLTQGDGLQVHHLDDNRLNNQRANLAVVTPGEHRRLHVGPLAGPGPYRARVMVNGRQMNLGRYPTEAEARAVVAAHVAKVGA